MEPFEDGGSWFDERFVVLGKISNSSFVPPDHFSVVQKCAVVAAGLAQFSFRDRRRVCQQSIHQRGLACSVPSHERDLLPASYARREILNHRNLPVRLAEMFYFQDVLA